MMSKEVTLRTALLSMYRYKHEIEYTLDGNIKARREYFHRHHRLPRVNIKKFGSGDILGEIVNVSLNTGEESSHSVVVTYRSKGRVAKFRKEYDIAMLDTIMCEVTYEKC